MMKRSVTILQNTLVCDECGEAAVLPSQPLQLGTPWACTHCNHAMSENVVKERVSRLLAQLKHLTVAERYNVDKWLQLDQQAARIVHPKHEV
jgi:DNA-directed RNA polymerase subunit RPC12/RpoP